MRATAVACALLLAGCVPHPVGPARTYAKYEGKAVTTAESAVSAVQTARLVVETAAKGNATATFTAMLLSEQEESLSGLQGTFGSIQPPDERADDLRDELGELLGDAADHVSTLRIIARRGQLDDLAEEAKPLDEDLRGLHAFAEEHGS